MNYIKKVKREIVKTLHHRTPSWIGVISRTYRTSELCRSVKRRLLDGEEVGKGEKVFGIGLSRTGTTSLAHALSYLGYKTGSWTTGGRVLSWPEFYYLDAATDTPCAANFESLYHTFEEAKFIYTTRDVDKWKESVKKHFEIDCPEKFRDRWSDSDFWKKKNTPESLIHMQVHENLYARHKSWEDAYISFDNRVKEFFDNKPEDKFLEVSITDGDGWESICRFLDKEVPVIEFPHESEHY